MYEKLLTALRDMQAQIEAINDQFDGAEMNDMADCRKAKAAFISMDSVGLDRSSEVYYLRHDKRIVISAPEVIIGNVTRDGLLMSDEGNVVSVRGSEVHLDGVGDAGRVEIKAPTILNMAVDPGIDGVENRVCDNSAVIAKARKVSLEASDSTAYLHRVDEAQGQGLYLHSDNQLSIDASKSRSSDSCDDAKASLEDELAAIRAAINTQLTLLDDLFDDITTFQTDKLNDFAHFLFNYKSADVEALHANIEKLMCDYTSELKIYFDLVSRAGELSYQIKAIDKEKEDLPTEAVYRDNTDCSLTLNAESVVVSNFDGDGTFRTNKGAGFSVLSKSIRFTDNQLGGELQNAETGSKFSVNSRDISLSGWTNALGNATSTLKAEGNISLNSKKIKLRTIDTTIDGEGTINKDNTVESDGGSISIRSSKISLKSKDKDGKATGAISATAKDIQLRSMDLEGKAEKELAADGKVVVLAKNVVVGGRKTDDAKELATQVDLLANVVNVVGKESAEISAADSAAVATLNSKGAIIASEATQVTSKSELMLKGKSVTIKGPLNVGSVSAKYVESSKGFKSHNISDGAVQTDASAAETPKTTATPATTTSVDAGDDEDAAVETTSVGIP